MTLRGIFSYQNLDSTEDLNSLNARIIDRGIFENGLLSPSATSLEISISPFRAVSYDGMVVISDATETVSVNADATSYLICYAKWLNNTSPHIEIKTISETEWSLSSNKEYFITFCKLTVPFGATSIDSSYIDYTDADYAEKAGKSNWRPRVSDYTLLPTIGNREGDVRVAGNRAYIWDSTINTWDSLITGENYNIILGNWSSGVDTGLTLVCLRSIAYGNGVIVAVGWGNSLNAPIYISKDKGVTWSLVTHGLTTYLNKIIFAEIDGVEKFIAAGRNKVMSSVDGETWIVEHTFSTSYYIYNLFITSTNMLVAVGEASSAPIIETTFDLSTWTNYNPTSGSFNVINDIAYDGINWVVAGNHIATNPDITNPAGWTRQVILTGEAISITHGNGQFITLTSSSSIGYATDITNWSFLITLSPSGYSGSKIAYLNEYNRFQYFAYKSGSGIAYQIGTSGLAWENFIGAINSTSRIMDVTTDDRGTVIAVTYDGYVFFSLRS